MDSKIVFERKASDEDYKKYKDIFTKTKFIVIEENEYSNNYRILNRIISIKSNSYKKFSNNNYSFDFANTEDKEKFVFLSYFLHECGPSHFLFDNQRMEEFDPNFKNIKNKNNK
ncbi:hypothetical protein ACTA71_004244 [Dictyostelium dimigraforme]